MKRSTASWTTAIAASALLAMPVGTWAQQPSPSPSQQTPSRPASAPAKPGTQQAGQQGASNEHLRLAETALNDIPAASLTGTTKSKVAELKRHISNLDKASGNKANAQKEVAAADRILTELLGTEGTTGATTPPPAGTTGTTPPAKAGAATLDEATRGKLQEVRTQLTTFAASMGSGSTPKNDAATPSADDPSAGASAAAASAAASPSASPSTPATASPSASPSTPASPTPQSEPPAAAQPPSTAQAQTAQPAGGAQPSAGQSVDTDSVKRHLTAARDSLAQLTQLPAAAQLTGDARTQISQLISNFNELITTNTEWRASYAKVQANLTALVGDQRADESPAPATGTAGAVGTTGTTPLDPGVRAKLVEFRSHLMEFEKAAGGGSASASASPASPASPTEPAAAAAAAQPSAQSPSTPPAATPATPAEPSPSEPRPTGTSGTTSPSPAGTTGSTAASPTPSTPSPAGEPSDQSSAPKSSSPQAAAGHSEAMQHLEAIEAILNGSSGTAGTTGSAASKPQGATSLNREQIEQIRTHLAALRKALNQTSK